MIKQRAKYRNFINTVCHLDEDNEYSLHYEFSDWITKADKHSNAALMKNLEQPKGIISEYCQWYNFRKGRRKKDGAYSCWKQFLKLGKTPRKRVRKKDMIWG